MLYIYYGTDTKTARSAVNALLETWKQKNEHISVTRITDETFEESEIDALLGSQGLFASRTVAVLDHVLAVAGAVDILTERFEKIAADDNVFILLEGKIDARTLKKFEKHAHKVQRFDAQEQASGTAFNTFALSDALGARNKKDLWVMVQRAHQHSVADEEMHGILFWQAKSMLLAASTQSAEEAGMKAFPYKKAKQYAQNYSTEELQRLLTRLVKIYHEARRGRRELGVALEQFALTL